MNSASPTQKALSVDSLSDEELRLQVATLCGWKRLQNVQNWWWHDDFGTTKIAPDYPNDLNAMHEAEKSLTLTQFRDYIEDLEVACASGMESVTVRADRKKISSTARQRAIAFIATLTPTASEADSVSNAVPAFEGGRASSK